jgi:hypothetical protein
MPAKFNKGDISEGILAAAITARFLSKTKSISYNDVISVIKKLKKPKGATKGLTTETEFQSPNEQKKVVDKVICKVNLADINMKAFLSMNSYNNKDVKQIVEMSVKYANGKNIMSWTNLLYENNQYNVIEVLSEGLLDQTGTKVDLKVLVDKKQVGVGISLKYGDVKQFGQVGGSKWESMEKLFKPLDVKFSKKTEDDYIKMLSEKKVAPALTLAYSEAVKQLNKKASKKLVELISNFMKYHATLGEKDVVLLQLKKNEALVYDFSVLQRKLLGYNLKIELDSGNTDKLTGFKGGSKIPKINILIAETDEILLTIRLKLEGNRVNSKGVRLPLTVRSYVEKGKATTKLLIE